MYFISLNNLPVLIFDYIWIADDTDGVKLKHITFPISAKAPFSCILPSRNLSSSFETIQPWENMGLASTYESHHFHLNHRDKVKTQVRVTNGALNTAVEETDSFIVDMTPPELVSLWDGLGDADIEFQVMFRVFVLNRTNRS